MATAMTPTEPTESLRYFLGMPSEIRLNIYGLLFIHSGPILLEVGPDGTLKAVNVSAVEFPLSLLSTSRRIHTEASPVVYQGNKYVIAWQTFSRPLSPQQLVSDYLRTIEIDCTSGEAWGFVQAIKSLTRSARGLREITLTFQRSARFVTAAVELSNALPVCASVFEMPILQATICPLKDDDLNTMDDTSPHIADIQKTLGMGIRGLSDVLQCGGPGATELTIGPVTSTLSGSDLSVIRLDGKVSRTLKTLFETHRCSTGNCAFVKDWERTIRQDADADTTSRRYQYTWKMIGAPVPDIDPNMRQWYPELPEKYKKMLKDVMLSMRMTDDADTQPDSGSGPMPTNAVQSWSGFETAQDDMDELEMVTGDLPNALLEGSVLLPPVATEHAEILYQDMEALLAETHEATHQQFGEEEEDTLGFADLAISDSQSDGFPEQAQPTVVSPVTANVAEPEQDSGNMNATPQGADGHTRASKHASTELSTSGTPTVRGPFVPGQAIPPRRRQGIDLDRLQAWLAEQRDELARASSETPPNMHT